MSADKPANTEQVYRVHPSDLPLCCPSHHMVLWNSHPRVYLSLEEGRASCPYCGAVYLLDAD